MLTTKCIDEQLVRVFNIELLVRHFEKKASFREHPIEASHCDGARPRNIERSIQGLHEYRSRIGLNVKLVRFGLKWKF